MTESTVFEVEPEKAGIRLDLYLSQALGGVSRNSVQRWIENGCVQVNSTLPKASYRVRSGDRIEARPPLLESADLVPEDIPISIVHEEDAFMVVDKPAGLVVHPGAGNPRGTLANALVYHFQYLAARETARPGIVHRLDRDTSGLLVVAKSVAIHELLSGQFKRREVEKHYLVLVYGHVQPPQGRIEAPLGRHPRLRTLMSIRSRRARAALTDYQVLRYLDPFTYLRAILHTGRTHQIRVHFQHLGHPVVGDRTYAPKAYMGLTDPALRQSVRRLQRHFIHATFLAFRHPLTGERVSFNSPLPPELEGFLGGLG